MADHPDRFLRAMIQRQHERAQRIKAHLGAVKSTRPRNFAAMRADRVTAMAERRFGRAFTSKTDAVKALAALPTAEQHALKKPVDGRAPARARSASSYSYEMRGGVATPAPGRVKAASDQVLRRYARAVTGIDARSRAQALAMLAKYGPTDVRKAVGPAMAAVRKPAPGPARAELVRQLSAATGAPPPASVKRSKASLTAALAGATAGERSGARQVPPTEWKPAGERAGHSIFVQTHNPATGRELPNYVFKVRDGAGRETVFNHDTTKPGNGHSTDRLKSFFDRIEKAPPMASPARTSIAAMIRAKDEAGLRAILSTNGVKVAANASLSTLRAAAAATTYRRMANRMAAGGAEASAQRYQRAAQRFERASRASAHIDALHRKKALPAAVAKPKGGPIGFQNKDTLDAALKAKGASAAGKAKPPTKAQARKASAREVFVRDRGREPGKKMSAAKIEAANAQWQRRTKYLDAAAAAKPKGGPIGFQNKDTLDAALKAKGASAAGKAKPPTKAQARKAAADKAFRDALGRAPAKNMTAAKMEAAVRSRAVSKARYEALAKQMAPPAKPLGDRPARIAALLEKRLGKPGFDRAVGRIARMRDPAAIKAVSKTFMPGVGLPTTHAAIRNMQYRNDRLLDSRAASATIGAPASSAAALRPAAPTLAQRARATASAALPYAGTALGVAGVGAAAGRGYHEARAAGKSRGEAAAAAAASAAVPAAIMAAPAIEKGARAVSSGGFMVARAALEIAAESPVMMAIGGWAAPAAVAIAGGGAVGVAAKAVEIGAKVVGRVALPAMAAWSVYQGAREDSNAARGAARGLVRAFDPTGIFMRRGLAERGFDQLAGRAGAPRPNAPGGTGSWGPQAYLNSSASARALAAAAPGQIGATRRQPGPVRSDGQTAAYSRVDPRTGKLVEVKAYSTPARG